jgi:hypothetical protein
MGMAKKLAVLAILIIGFFYFWTDKGSDDSPEPGSKEPVAHARENKMENSSSQASQASKATNNPQTPRARPEPITTKEKFLKKYPGNWVFGEGKNGGISYISGATIDANITDEARAQSFAESIAPLFSVPPEQLANETKMIAETKMSKAYQTSQTVDGFVVYQGMLVVHTRTSDGAVYIVNNDLKDVGPYNRVPAITPADGEAIIRAHYGVNLISVTLKAGPVIFASLPPTELAFIFHVEINGKTYHTLEVVVGAESKKILAETSTTIR